MLRTIVEVHNGDLDITRLARLGETRTIAVISSFLEDVLDSFLGTFPERSSCDRYGRQLQKAIISYYPFEPCDKSESGSSLSIRERDTAHHPNGF